MSQTDSSSTPSSLNLLSLPPELRLQIYRQVFTGVRVAHFAPVYDYVPVAELAHFGRPLRFEDASALLRVAKQIRREASRIFYTEATLCFCSAYSYVPSHRYFYKANWALVTKVEMWDDYRYPSVQCCPVQNLQELTLIRSNASRPDCHWLLPGPGQFLSAQRVTRAIDEAHLRATDHLFIDTEYRGNLQAIAAQGVAVKVKVASMWVRRCGVPLDHKSSNMSFDPPVELDNLPNCRYKRGVQTWTYDLETDRITFTEAFLYVPPKRQPLRE